MALFERGGALVGAKSGETESGAALYEDEISSMRTELLFIGLAALFLGLFWWRLMATGFGLFAGALLLLAVLFIGYSVNYRVLRIRITAVSLYLRFGVFRWTIPKDSIEGICTDRTSLWRIGGAGIHLSPIGGRYRAMWKFLEYPRVVVALKRRRGRRRGLVRDIAFSTSRPEDVKRAIEVALAHGGAEAQPEPAAGCCAPSLTGTD